MNVKKHTKKVPNLLGTQNKKTLKNLKKLAKSLPED